MDEQLQLTQADVERMVMAAMDQIPQPFADQLRDEANLEVFVAARPTWRQRRAVKLGLGRDLYGLYEGIPRPRRGRGYNFVAPDVITIFSDALLRDFPDPVQLEQQVRRTVLHEVAHYFGMSDDYLIAIDRY